MKTVEQNGVIMHDIPKEIQTLDCVSHMFDIHLEYINRESKQFLTERPRYERYNNIRVRLVRLSRRTIIVCTHLCEHNVHVPGLGFGHQLAIVTHVINMCTPIALKRCAAVRIRHPQLRASIAEMHRQPLWIKEQILAGVSNTLKCDADELRD